MTTTDVSTLNRPLGGKYLIFVLGREYYGLPVLRVREIIRYVPPTLVPQLPSHVKGVINLRGKIIPVVDLRDKFNLQTELAGQRGCIIVVQIQAPDTTQRAIGIVVDSVEEVLQITMQEIEPAPDFGSEADTNYILGMAKTRDAVRTLLDIDRVLAADAEAQNP
jgi:purine-binding chemotaxis protein CheW